MDDVWANAWSDPVPETKPNVVADASDGWPLSAAPPAAGSGLRMDWQTPTNVIQEDAWGGASEIETAQPRVSWSVESSEDPWKPSFVQPTDPSSSNNLRVSAEILEEVHEISDTEGLKTGIPHLETTFPEESTENSAFPDAADSESTAFAELSQAHIDASDGFGTFESALHTAGEVWEPSGTPLADRDSMRDGEGWGSTWTSHTSDHPTKSDRPLPSTSPDEWSAALERKNLHDARVPEELMMSILGEWTEMSLVLFPPSANKGNDDAEIYDSKHLTSLQALVESIAPLDFHVAPLRPFPTTIAYKNMETTLKLTRHNPSSILSPLSQLLASKGASTWENSVRTRVEPEVDDWSWMGGKPKDLDAVTVPQEAPQPEKRAGLLASIWRKSSQPVARVSPTASPKPASPPPPTAIVGASPKTSLDVPTQIPGPNVAVITEIPSSNPTTPAPSSLSSTAPETLSNVPSLYDGHIAADTPPATDMADILDPQPPTAVSRFWDRFSRSRTSSSSSILAQHASLNDSDFSMLENIPRMGVDDDPEDQMKALEDMLASQPSPSFHMPSPSSSAFRTLSKSTTGPKMPSNKVDDMWAIFDTVPPSPKLSAPVARMSGNVRSSSSILPPPLAPPPRIPPPSSRSTTPQPPPTLSIPTRILTTNQSPQPPKPPPKHSRLSMHEFDDFSSLSPTTLRQSPVLSPNTPASRKIPSPILISATPTSARNEAFGGMDADDGFGDFMSPTGTEMEQTLIIPSDGLAPPLKSPRITAPDTPTHESDMPQPHQPPHRSLSPLMNKVARTTSSKWPRPSSPPPSALPPAIAPPPSGPSTGSRASIDVVTSPVLRNGAPNAVRSSFPGVMASSSPRSSPVLSQSPLFRANSPARSSLPALLPPPPPGATTLAKPIQQLAPMTSPTPPPLAPSRVTQPPKGANGLSAADLSFFEGL